MFGLGKKKAKGQDGEAGAEAEAPEAAAADPDALALEGDGHPKKKKPPVMLIAAALGALVVVGGGGTGAFLMLKKPAAVQVGKDGKPLPKKEKKKEEKKGEGAEGKKINDPNAPVVKDGPDGVVFYTLPDVVVNMQTADGRPSFLKLKLTLELPDHDTADILNPNMPRLQDMFQVFLRELRPEDLAGSQGGFQLRTEILRRVNLVIAPSKANAVLIEEMLVN
jgi:flagellar FliL protein